MRKIIFYLLLLISTVSFGQTTLANKLKITAAIKDNLATRIMVQDSLTGELKWVLKNSLGTVKSVTGTNGVTVALGTTTPVIGLGAITPTSTNGVSATTMAYNDATSSIQTQLNGKQPSGTYASGTGSATGTNTGDNAVNTLYSGLVTNATHTGEVTGATALTITPKAVTLAKMDDVATGTVFYRKTAATGTPEVQTLATLKTDLGLTGTNTGDQTTISGNAGTATTLQTGRTIAITGDLAYTSPTFNGSANVTAAGTLATVNANVGSFTNASVTVNAKGLVTAASSGPTPQAALSGTGLVRSTAGAITYDTNAYITTVNGTAITPSSTNGVSAATMAFNDATSSIQTQLNGKQAAGTYATGTGTASGTNTGDNAVNTLYSGLVTNVPTALSTGTVSTISYGITSDGSSDDIVLPQANTTQAGLLSAAKWNEIVANTAKVSNANHTGDATGSTALSVVGINGTLLSSLGTGILKNTTTTGVPSIAVAADFPTLNQNTTGTASNITGVYGGTITSSQVTTGLGFTPYNATNPSGYTSNTGTVTSVSALTLGTTGTDLSSTVATGTTTPVITLNVPTASATNRGALSSTDWSTFNNKQNALTNPITGTGTTNYLPKFTGSTSLGDSSISDNGTTVSIINPSTTNNTLNVRNSSYDSTVASGTASLGFGFSNHIGAKIEAYKQAVNITGFKFYTENGFNTPLLALTLGNGGQGIFEGSLSSKLEVQAGSDTQTNSALVLNGTSGSIRTLSMRTAGIRRWGWRMDDTAESGSNAGSDLRLTSYVDAGTQLSDILFIKRSTGNIGIGTTNPNFSSANRTTVDINGTSQSMLALSVGGIGKGFLFHTGTDLLVSNEGNGAINFNTNGSNKAQITSGGNVLIGTTVDNGWKFRVNGGAYFDGNISQSISDSRINGGDTVGRLLLSNSDTTTYMGLYGSAHATLPNGFKLFTNAVERIHVNASGAVKISSLASGTTTQMVTADLNGVLGYQALPSGGGATNLSYTASPTNGVVASDTGTDATIPLANGTNAGLLAPAESNILSVLNANTTDKTVWNNGHGGVLSNVSFGSTSLSNNTTGAGNSVFGYSSLVSNSTGSFNTALGASSLATSNGSQNTAVGYSSLALSTASGNTAVGYSSLANNVSGTANAIMGDSSFFGLTSGSNNVGIGASIGKIADGTTNATAIDNSVVIGNLAKVLANSQTNQIVIGYNATGNGSNTTTIGNASTTDTYLKGVVRGGSFISTQVTPTAKTATATLTIAEILTDITTVTSTTAVTLTLPTGTLTDAGVQSGTLAVNESFEWVIINLGTSSGAVTMAAGTGHTYVGATAVAIGTSATFRTRKTAANTFVTYRI